MAGSGPDPGREPLGGALGGTGIARLPGAHDRSRLAVIVLHERVHPLPGARLVLVDCQGQVHGAGQLVGITPRLARDLMDFFPLRAPALRVGGVREPAVIKPADPFEACPNHAAKPDRRSAGTVRHRAERRLLDNPSAVPRNRLAGPQLAAEPQPFEHASDALFEWHAAGDELGADVRPVAGDANAENEAAFADLVQSRDAVRQHDWVAQYRQQHRGAQLDATGARGNVQWHGQRLVPRPGEDPIADPPRTL